MSSLKERRQELMDARRYGRACLLRVQAEVEQMATYNLALSECEISAQRMLDFLEECIENLDIEIGGEDSARNDSG